MLTKPQIIFIQERILSILGIQPPPVFYIGGSDTLPPPLERDAEEKAIAGLDVGDEASRRLLIEHNLRLVVYISKRFENTGINIEDLISIGTIGLIKAVNTFKSSKNIKLATYASRCIENEISRISAYAMVFTAFLLGKDYSGENAFRIFRRDNRKHASPNSAQTEAACAGALGIRLAGDASYFGKIVHKPYIGDSLRPVEYEDIKRANVLMYGTTVTCWGGCLAVMLLIYSLV